MSLRKRQRHREVRGTFEAVRNRPDESDSTIEYAFFLVKSCNQLDRSGYLYQIICSKGRTVRQRRDVSREVLRFCVPYTDMRID